MDLSSTSFNVIGTTGVNPTLPGVSGTAVLKQAYKANFPLANMAMAGEIDFGTTGKSMGFRPGTFAFFGPGGAVTYQSETLTAAGTITTAGNATLTVTAADIAGSPVLVTFAVAETDSPAVWAGKARAALAANRAITEFYSVGGSTTAISLTSLVNRVNDATLNIVAANLTCEGIAIVTPNIEITGTAGVITTGGRVTDVEGVANLSPASLQVLMIENAGATAVTIAGGALSGTDTFSLQPGAIFCVAGASIGTAGPTGWMKGDTTMASTGKTLVRVYAIGTGA